MTDMDKLIVDLEKAGRRVVPMAAAALNQAVRFEEKKMSNNFSGHPSFRHVPKAVDSTVRGLNAEIGVNKRKRQGAIANILAYGTATQPPVVDHTRGFDTVASGFQKSLQEGLGRLL